jgi:hypothetical protein
MKMISQEPWGRCLRKLLTANIFEYSNTNSDPPLSNEIKIEYRLIGYI